MDQTYIEQKSKTLAVVILIKKFSKIFQEILSDI